jgi:hypothetical protein
MPSLAAHAFVDPKTADITVGPSNAILCCKAGEMLSVETFLGQTGTLPNRIGAVLLTTLVSTAGHDQLL